MTDNERTWIAKHGGGPEMAAFLAKMRMDGFNLHRADDTVVLIYSGDQAGLFPDNKLIRRRARTPDSYLTLGEQAYRDREAGERWEAIQARLGPGCHGLAKRWAVRRGVPWPVPLTEEAKARAAAERADRIKAARAARSADAKRTGRTLDKMRVDPDHFEDFERILRAREDGDLSPAYLARKLSGKA